MNVSGPQLFVNFLPVLRTRCVDGITANPEKCRHYLEESPSVITALTPKIGYAKAAEVFKDVISALRSDDNSARVLDKRSSPRVGLRTKLAIVTGSTGPFEAAPVEVWLRDHDA